MIRELLPRAWRADLRRSEVLPRSFLHEVSELGSAFDSLFEEVFGPLTTHDVRAWQPALETKVKDGKLFVHCDLPGVNPKDVEVSVEGDTLSISGERRAERTSEDEGGRRSEVSYGRFQRVLAVPEGIEADKITARYTNGVLEVEVPLPTAKLPKKVTVRVGDSPKRAA
jgi:HSP20 family protein